MEAGFCANKQVRKRLKQSYVCVDESPQALDKKLQRMESVQKERESAETPAFEHERLRGANQGAGPPTRDVISPCCSRLLT